MSQTFGTCWHHHQPLVWRMYPMGWYCPQCISAITITTQNHTKTTANN